MESTNVITRVRDGATNYKTLLETLLEIGGAKKETITLLTSEKYVTMFKLAFVHKSRNPDQNYQRVEFLGDTIVNFIIALYLFEQKKSDTHAQLTNRKHKMVASKFLGDSFIMTTGVYKLLDPPYESVMKGLKEEEKKKLSGDIFEAMIGMLFNIISKERSFAVASEITKNVLIEFLKTVEIASPDKDPKTTFKETIEHNPHLKIEGMSLGEEKEHMSISGTPQTTIRIYINAPKGFNGGAGGKIKIAESKGPDENRVRNNVYTSANNFINKNKTQLKIH